MKEVMINGWVSCIEVTIVSSGESLESCIQSFHSWSELLAA
jgi:hypothetical protein